MKNEKIILCHNNSRLLNTFFHFFFFLPRASHIITGVFDERVVNVWPVAGAAVEFLAIVCHRPSDAGRRQIRLAGGARRSRLSGPDARSLAPHPFAGGWQGPGVPVRPSHSLGSEIPCFFLRVWRPTLSSGHFCFVRWLIDGNPVRLGRASTLASVVRGTSFVGQIFEKNSRETFFFPRRVLGSTGN